MAPTNPDAIAVAATYDKSVKPTLKTIATISGLAVPTVSRALNDAPDIGSDTKVLIRRIADEIGYVPNRAGVRLRTGRTNVISLLMPAEHDLMNHSVRLVTSVAGGLRNTPFHVIVTPFFPDQDPMESVRYVVETRSADAIIMNQIQARDPRVAYLMDRRFPFATHGRTEWADQHAYYDFDNTAFGRLAMAKLADRGRRNVLLIAPPPKHHYCHHLTSGAEMGAQTNGLTLRIAETVTSDGPSNEIISYVQQHMRTHPETDAIIPASTSAAIASVTAIEGRGAKIGDQIDIFAKEAVPFLRLFRADILTVAEEVGSAGEFLAKAAINAIKNPGEPPMQRLEVPEG